MADVQLLIKLTSEIHLGEVPGLALQAYRLTVMAYWET